MAVENVENVVNVVDNPDSWLDFDVIQHEVALRLGLYQNEQNPEPCMRDFKWLYWTSNVYSNELCKIVASMVTMGLLERNEEEQYRWAKNFRVN